MPLGAVFSAIYKRDRKNLFVRESLLCAFQNLCVGENTKHRRPAARHHGRLRSKAEQTISDLAQLRVASKHDCFEIVLADRTQPCPQLSLETS
jgi:hypothetical protein